MSAGNPIIKTRIPRQLLDELYLAIVEYNFRHPRKRTNVSRWLIGAIREKLAHVKRSHKPKKSKGDDSAEVISLGDGIIRDTNTGEEWQCPTK